MITYCQREPNLKRGEAQLDFMQHFKLAILFTTAVFATAASAEDPGRGLLDNFLNDVSTLSARFEQSLVDTDSNIVEETNGTFELQRPGRFRWSVQQPYEQLMVADGLNVWSYDVDLDHVTVKPQADVLASTPALLLGGGENALDDFDYIGSSEDRGTFWVELRPKSSDNGFTKLELGFNAGDLRRMIFSDNLQQSTLIALFDLEINQAIDSTHFEFNPPAGVDLVGIPAFPSASVGHTDD